MTVESRHVQIEPGGITYDRFRLLQIFADLVPAHGVRTALEFQAGGEKAMPSIYSVGLAKAGCRVTLLNPVPTYRASWAEVGFEDRVTSIDGDPARTGLPAASFDLVWNFVSLSKTGDFEGALKEMGRLASKLVVTVHTSAYNVGYPWHRLIHKALGFPWTHGDTRYSFPREVARAYRSAGLTVSMLLPFDSPPWPDPPGFRDIALHRKGLDRAEDASIEWRAPILEYMKSGHYPAWMRALSRIERLPIPRLVRYPVSHLFMVMAEVAR